MTHLCLLLSFVGINSVCPLVYSLWYHVGTYISSTTVGVPLFDDSSRTSSPFLNSSFSVHLWGSSYLPLILSISIREFIPNIRWTFILFLTTGPFIFLFIEGWKVHFFSFHLLTLRATVSFISRTWLSRHLVSMLGVRSRHLSFFIYGAYFRHLFFHVWSSSSPSFFLHLWRLFSPSFLGWHFFVLTSFPSMREIPFIGSLSTTPTFIGPSFHWDFRVILHSGIFTLFPADTLYHQQSHVLLLLPF